MNTYIKKSILLGALSLSINAAYAQTYPGINFPRPQVDENSVIKKENNPPQLDELLSPKIKENGAAAQKAEISEMRRQGIFDMASSVAASSGLIHRMNEIKIDVNKNAARLDRLFDFSNKDKVLITDGVLAPVLVEGLSNYSKNNDDEIRVSDKIYKIEVPAKFVSVYPTWRSYLVFSYPTYDMPPAAYLPKDDAEKAIWDDAVKQGWKQGIEQANNIFEKKYNLLQRDYSGMVKYKILLAQGLITPTIIAKQNLGVTGGGREMALNDQIFRISEHSSLNSNTKEWTVETPVSSNVNGELK